MKTRASSSHSAHSAPTCPPPPLCSPAPSICRDLEVVSYYSAQVRNPPGPPWTSPFKPTLTSAPPPHSALLHTKTSLKTCPPALSPWLHLPRAPLPAPMCSGFVSRSCQGRTQSRTQLPPSDLFIPALTGRLAVQPLLHGTFSPGNL